MAGSLKWMVYMTDSGQQYAVWIDESNGKAGGFLDMSNGVTLQTLPRGIKMRYVNTVNAETGVRRRIYLGKPDNPLKNGGTVQLPLYSGNTATMKPFAVSSYRAEKRRTPYGQDTGLNDGDAA